MKIFTLRLKPEQDLKKELDKFTKENSIQAGFIITCVGSLKQAVLRYAGIAEGTELTGKFEIISLVGTLSQDGSHLHATISDETGKTIVGACKAGVHNLHNSRDSDRRTRGQKVHKRDG